MTISSVLYIPLSLTLSYVKFISLEIFYYFPTKHNTGKFFQIIHFIISYFALYIRIDTCYNSRMIRKGATYNAYDTKRDD